MSTWYYISNDEGYNRTSRSFVLFFLLGKPALGQHNFEFSSVSRFNDKKIVVGQATFLLHISYEILLLLEGISVGKS